MILRLSFIINECVYHLNLKHCKLRTHTNGHTKIAFVINGSSDFCQKSRHTNPRICMCVCDKRDLCYFFHTKRHTHSHKHKKTVNYVAISILNGCKKGPYTHTNIQPRHTLPYKTQPNILQCRVAFLMVVITNDINNLVIYLFKLKIFNLCIIKRK